MVCFLYPVLCFAVFFHSFTVSTTGFECVNIFGFVQRIDHTVVNNLLFGPSRKKSFLIPVSTFSPFPLDFVDIKLGDVESIFFALRF